MMENVRKISKKYYFRQVMACWMVSLMLFGIPAKVVLADPNPGADAHPSTDAYTATLGGIAGTAGNTTTVIAPDGSIFEWNNFDIGSNHTVNIVQGVDDAVLNRVNALDGLATGINGALNADGTVFIVNPRGIVFGPQAYVLARNLVASSLNISDSEWNNVQSTVAMQFTGGGIGDIETKEGSRIKAEAIALIGRNVINRGALIGDFVLLAAGDSVLITGDPETSNVVVEVAMADPALHTVDNGGELGTGTGSITMKNSVDAEIKGVILAAGDIFSTAIEGVEFLRAEAKRDVVIEGGISAYSEGHSDAVATVEIDAGRDVTVNGEIYAGTSVDTDDPADNATSTIKIKAGENVFIYDRVVANAEAEDGSGDATATIGIDAGKDVLVAAGTDEFTVYANAEADDSGDATVKIEINAGGGVEIDNSELEAAANTDWSGNAISSTHINAGGDVIVENDSEVCTEAETDNGAGDATVDSKVNAGSNVIVREEDSEICGWARTYADSGDATVNVSIEADGDVIVENDTEIRFYAYTSDAGDATVGLTVKADNVTVADNSDIKAEAEASYSGDATATVDVEAEGDVIVGDESQIYASAGVYTEGIIPDYDSELPFVIGSVVQQAEPIPSVADTLDATADVTITADGEVIVDEYGQIYAEAWVNVEQMYYGGPTVTLLAQGDGGYGGDEVLSVPGDATANVTILADDGVTVGIDGEIWAEARIEENYYEGLPSAAYSSVRSEEHTSELQSH